MQTLQDPGHSECSPGPGLSPHGRAMRPQFSEDIADIVILRVEGFGPLAARASLRLTRTTARASSALPVADVATVTAPPAAAKWVCATAARRHAQ